MVHHVRIRRWRRLSRRLGRRGYELEPVPLPVLALSMRLGRVLCLLLMEPLIVGLGSNVYNIMRRYTRQRNMPHAHKYRNR